MRKSLTRDAAADVFAQPQALRGGLANPVVELAGLAPQSEFAAADVACDALGGGADARQFVVVNRARAVDGDVIEHAALDEVDDLAIDAGAQHVCAHHENARGARALRRDDARGDIIQLRMGVSERSILEGQPIVEVQIVGALRQRAKPQTGAVEEEIFTGHWRNRVVHAVPRGRGNWG